MKISFEITLGNYNIKTRPLVIKSFGDKTFAVHYSKNASTLLEFDLMTSSNQHHSGIFFNFKILGRGLEVEFFKNCHH